MIKLKSFTAGFKCPFTLMKVLSLSKAISFQLLCCPRHRSSNVKNAARLDFFTGFPLPKMRKFSFNSEQFFHSRKLVLCTVNTSHKCFRISRSTFSILLNHISLGLALIRNWLETHFNFASDWESIRFGLIKLHAIEPSGFSKENQFRAVKSLIQLSRLRECGYHLLL